MESRSNLVKVLVCFLISLGLIAVGPTAWQQYHQAQETQANPQVSLTAATAIAGSPELAPWHLDIFYNTVTPVSTPDSALESGLDLGASTITAGPTSILYPSPTVNYPGNNLAPFLEAITPSVPAEHDVPPFSVRHQLLPLDCEAAAATQWAAYYGVKIDEIEFQRFLPRSDNPDYGFVGNVNDAWGEVPPHGYGVYAGPVAALLNTYHVPAAAYKDFTLEQLKAKIAADDPVIAWVVGNVEAGTAYPYLDSKGRTVMVAAYEHVIIVTGYTADVIRYTTEGEDYSVTIQTFMKSFAVLGNMVVTAP